MANELKESKKVKSGKKAFYKRWWFKAFVIIVLLCAITGNDGETSEAPETAPPTEVIENTEPMAIETENEVEVIEEEPKETEVSTEPTGETMEGISYTIDDATFLLRLSMKDSFENYEVVNDGEAIFINVWDEGLSLNMGLATLNGEEYKEEWDNMAESMKEMCSMAYSVVNEDMGLGNVPVTLNLLNDMNKDLTLLSITNGVVFYDSVNMG